MAYLYKFNLQLFAGEGSGGDGGGEGATMGVGGAESSAASVPMEQRWREMGVPENEILNLRAHRQTAAAKAQTAPVEQASTAVTEEAQQDAQQVAAAETTEAQTEETAGNPISGRMSWDQIVADPEYNAKMQEMMQARLRSAKSAEANLGKLAPALEVLARKHNMDVNNLDYAALAEAVTSDDDFFEDLAFQRGVTREEAKQQYQKEQETKRQQAEQKAMEHRQNAQNHIAGLLEQSQELQSEYPDLNIFDELSDPWFAHMTSPTVGLTVKQAYESKYHKQLMDKYGATVRQETLEQQSRNIQANRSRPVEHGTSSTVAPVVKKDYRNMTSAEREAFLRKVELARQRGEKIYPGQEFG